MTYLLHLETATKVCSVALSVDGELKQLMEISEKGYSHGENLTCFIDDCLKAEKISFKNLAAISISSGPGSYTGLRIGISVAKGLCYALNLPLIAIDSLTCIFEAAKEKHPGKTIIPMIDARRMEVFSAVFDSEGKKLKEISADIVDENSYLEFGDFTACGDGAEKCRSVWENRDIELDPEILSSAKAQVKSAYQKFLRQEFEDVAYFEPFYLKDFVAGVKKQNSASGN